LSGKHLLHQWIILRANDQNNKIFVNKIYIPKTQIINKYLIYFSVFRKFYGEDGALLEEIIALNVVGNNDESSKRKLIWKARFNDNHNAEEIRNVIQ
jgi:hypothetical protein